MTYRRISRLVKPFAILIILFSCTSAWSTSFNDLLAEKKAPAGVVIEIVSSEPGLLSELLPSIKANIKRLRDRFPDIPVAIVTHGTEQFDLTTNNKKIEATAHKMVEELVKSNDVNVHVCGTHAGWYNVSPEDFPEYVDVSPAGPAQINDYEELGYELIVLP